MNRQLLKNIACLTLIMAVGFVVLSLKSGTAHATYVSSNLISDPLFADSNIMTPTDIQNFLNSKNSGIRTLTDVESCSPATPTLPDPYAGTYYPRCGQTLSAANLIYDAAQSYSISPRVILATLQKEQSLITDPTPWQNNTAAVNCAMGYLSCGGGVSGFFEQVDNGAWQMRTYIELMNGRNWWGYTPASYPCRDAIGTPPAGHDAGGNNNHFYSPGLYPGRSVTFYDYYGDAYTTITLNSSATAAMYCYTPHVYPGSTATYYSGSYNFVNAYESWWGSTIGDLLKAPGGGVYKIESGTKRAFPSETIFFSYSYKWSDVVTISSTELSQIPNGADMPYNIHLRDGHLVTSPSGGVYVVDNGTKRPFPNEATFFTYGYKYSDALVISSSELSQIPDGAAMLYNVHARDGHLVTSPSGGVYVIDNGTKRPFPNELYFLSYFYKYSDATVISNSEISLIPYGVAMPYNLHYRDGHLVTARSIGVYVIENGLKRPFPNEATFFSYGYKYSDALIISSAELNLIPDGAAMPPKS